MRRPFELLLLLLIACAHATRAPRTPDGGEPVLRTVTYNLNYGMAGDGPTLDALEANDADVIFLQETNARWRAAIERRLGARYPGRVWLDGAAASGMAVLSKRPLIAQKLDNPSGWFPALRVVTETPVGRIQALCLHLHPPVTEDGSWVRGYFSTGGVRDAELEQFLKALDPGVPTLIAGDFNESNTGRAIERLEQLGYRTALPEFEPRAKTWHWPLGSMELTAQLDHVAYSRELEPLDARVVRSGRSDHFPVAVNLVRARPGVQRPPRPSSGGSISIASTP